MEEYVPMKIPSRMVMEKSRMDGPPSAISEMSTATMLLGIFIGTYSSIYIASPVVLYFSQKHNLREEIQKAADAEASV